MSKKQARELLQGLKALKGFEIYKIEVLHDNAIIFTCSKKNKGYYGLYDVDGVNLELAGNLNDLE